MWLSLSSWTPFRLRKALTLTWVLLWMSLMWSTRSTEGKLPFAVALLKTMSGGVVGSLPCLQ